MFTESSYSMMKFESLEKLQSTKKIKTKKNLFFLLSQRNGGGLKTNTIYIKDLMCQIMYIKTINLQECPQNLLHKVCLQNPKSLDLDSDSMLLVYLFTLCLRSESLLNRETLKLITQNAQINLMFLKFFANFVYFSIKIDNSLSSQSKYPLSTYYLMMTMSFDDGDQTDKGCFLHTFLIFYYKLLFNVLQFYQYKSNRSYLECMKLFFGQLQE